MFRRLMIVVAGLALLTTAVSCGNETSTTGSMPSVPPGSTAEAIQKRGKVVVGIKFDQPGFGNKTMADEPEGFDVEVAKILAKGIVGDNIEGKVEFQEAQSRVREEYIEKGTVDFIIATYSITDARKQRVSFAGPYLVAGQSLLVRSSDNSINSADDLAGKKVCSVRGSTPLANIQKVAPQADTSLSFDGYADCVEALKDGRIDAVTTDDQILLGYQAEDPDKIKVVGKPFSTEKYGIGVKKDDKQFRDFLNDLLEKSNSEGTWAKAYADTIGTKTGASPPPFPAIERY